MSEGAGGLRSARAITFTVLVALCLVFTALLGHPELLKRLTRENGVVESLSAALWVGAGLVSLFVGARTRGGRGVWLLGAILLLVLAAREADFQKRFTDWNLANRSNYLDPEIPARERLVVLGLVLLPLGVVLLAFLARIWRPFRDAWRRGERWPRDVPIWLLMILVAGRLDKFHHYMPGLGISAEWSYVPRMFEEAIELCLALFVVLTLMPAWRRALAQPGPSTG